MKDELDEDQRSLLVGEAVDNAQEIVSWAGNDDETDDILRKYLGEGSPATTNVAFSFARDVAKSDPLRLVELVKSRSSGKTSEWCHLARILYRPWYQNAGRRDLGRRPDEVLVLCGCELISLAILHLAAYRIKQIEPAPRIIEVISTSLDSFGYETGELGRWIKLRYDFGFDTNKFMTQVCVLSKKGSLEGQHRCLELLFRDTVTHSQSSKIHTMNFVISVSRWMENQPWTCCRLILRIRSSKKTWSRLFKVD